MKISRKTICDIAAKWSTLTDCFFFYASPGVISVPFCVCQADNIVPPPRVVTPPVTPVPPRVVLVPIVVVVVSASVIRSIYVGSALVWIDASSALREKLFRK